MMTWDEFLEDMARSGLPYLDIGEDSHGNIVVTFDLKEKRDGGGRVYLASDDEFANDVEE